MRHVSTYTVCHVHMYIAQVEEIKEERRDTNGQRKQDEWEENSPKFSYVMQMKTNKILVTTR